MKRREHFQYYFMVEGQTEKWYLEHIQKLINDNAELDASVKFIPYIGKEPMSVVKRLSSPYETILYCLVDCESKEPEHVQAFEYTLHKMKMAEMTGKAVKCELGYSNYAFDLWIVLHKKELLKSLSHRGQYLSYINDLYQTQFQSMSEYKNERNFNSGILNKIKIEDVISAIDRAERIMSQSQNETSGRLKQLDGFKYFTENPSLSVHNIIRGILKDVGIL